jgi:hypothetical protein
MDLSSGAGQVNPAKVAATVKSVITNHQTTLNAVEASISASLPAVPPSSYAVADLFGRCFLRVCYWVDVFTSMRRRAEPLPYVPFAHQPIRLAPIEPAHVLLEASPTKKSTGTPPVANA